MSDNQRCPYCKHKIEITKDYVVFDTPKKKDNDATTSVYIYLEYCTNGECVWLGETWIE